MKWIAIEGMFEFDKVVKFQGKPATFTTPQGEEKVGLSAGIAISSESFSGGEISAEVEFDKVGEASACELIFYYDPTRRAHVSAGIGGIDSAFNIRHFDGNWRTHASCGSRQTLKPKHRYDLRVTVRGSRVGLSVDGVEVLGAVVPFALPPSQAGIFCLDDSSIRISNFQIQSGKGQVFVVMQFSPPFNEIHEEVIKNVCDEFNLQALRADDTYGPGMIVADMTRDIADSEFVIAEITPPNPNVYYELGYSHAINKPVILLANRNLEKLPFDVSPFRVLFYDNSIVGKRHFEEGLRKHISAILGKNFLLAGSESGLAKQ